MKPLTQGFSIVNNELSISHFRVGLASIELNPTEKTISAAFKMFEVAAPSDPM